MCPSDQLSALGPKSDLTAAKSDFRFPPDTWHAAAAAAMSEGCLRRWHRGPYPHSIAKVYFGSAVHIFPRGHRSWTSNEIASTIPFLRFYSSGVTMGYAPVNPSIGTQWSGSIQRGSFRIPVGKAKSVVFHGRRPASIAGGSTADRATVRQKKTGRPVRFELSEQTRQAIDDYLKAANKRPGQFLFTARGGVNAAMSTRQYARLVSEWIGSVGLDPRLFGTHSLRRTKATLIYRRTGNLRAVQLLLGDTKIESTVRYLGIEVDDALAIAEQVDV